MFSNILVFVVLAHSQDTCAGTMAVNINCSGPNNCSQSVAVLRPIFSSAPTCLETTFVWCCDSQQFSYGDTGESCSGFCDDAVRALLKDRDASEFSLTHTVWAKDCSGRYRPFARLWDAPEKRIDLRSRLALSGFGG